MKYLLSIMLVWLCVILISCISVLLITGCAEQLTSQPTFFSPTEKHIMYVPKGCKIGDIVAPEDGIFIGKSKIIDLRIIEVPQPEKQKKIRT